MNPRPRKPHAPKGGTARHQRPGSAKAKTVTIHEVARVAGVSASTVSHVLSGKRPIGDTVKARVRQVIGELGYRANASAVHLSLRKTSQIGILVQEVSGAVTGLLLEGMESVARERGYKVILGITGLDSALAHQYLRDFSAGMVDGVVNMVPLLGAAQATLECPTVPVVTYERPYPECPAIDDRVGGARALVAHLASHGHRKIALLYVKDPAPELARETLLDGLALGERENGIPVDLSLAEAVDPRSVFELERGCDRVWGLGATAIIASSDAMASVVLRWARQRDIPVPGRLSVAGFDDAPVAAMLVPSLTSVRKPVAALARHTVEALVSRIAGMATSPTVSLSMELVPRESTGRAFPRPSGKSNRFLDVPFNQSSQPVESRTQR